MRLVSAASAICGAEATGSLCGGRTRTRAASAAALDLRCDRPLLVRPVEAVEARLEDRRGSRAEVLGGGCQCIRPSVEAQGEPRDRDVRKLGNSLPGPVDSITKFPRMCSDSGPFSSTPRRGRKSFGLGATRTTGPVSALGTNGDVALADPTIVLGGHPEALTSNWISLQLFVRRAALAPMLFGSRSFACARPASVSSCWMTVVSGTGEPGFVAPCAPTLTLSVGENGRASQLVGVKDGALPWAEWPPYDTASKVTVLGVHEVGLRMKPCPFAVPMRLRSSDVMSVSSPLAVRGKSFTIVSRPKSLRRSWTPDCWMILVAPISPPSGRNTIPNRAGSP